MAAALPDPPDDWTVSTATETHLALYDPAAGRSLVIRPTEPRASDEWTVKGLAGYGPEYPVFADGVDREEAISEAWEVMETVAAGETVSPIRTETTAGDAISATGDGETEAEAESETETDAVDQADLTAFSDGD
ncbi:MAG: hypothetical protein ABEH60_00380 [Halonotius sp.]